MRRHQYPDNEVHSCSHYCERPACVKAQRDRLRDQFVVSEKQATSAPSANQESEELSESVPREELVDAFNSGRKHEQNLAASSTQESK